MSTFYPDYEQVASITFDEAYKTLTSEQKRRYHVRKREAELLHDESLQVQRRNASSAKFYQRDADRFDEMARVIINKAKYAIAMQRFAPVEK